MLLLLCKIALREELPTTCRRCRPYKADVPFRCGGFEPILSRTSADSSIRILILGARLDVFPAPIVLRQNAKQAAKDIMIAVLFGIDFKRLSPCTAARMTFKDDERPAARKNRFTSIGAVG